MVSANVAAAIKETKSLESLKEQLIQERELGNLEQEARICNLIAKKYESSGKYHLALKYHLCDLEISEGIADLEGVCTALGNIAESYRILKKFLSSYETQVKRIELAKSQGFSDEEFNGYFGMGLLYSEWSCASFEASFVDLDYLQMSIEFFQKAMEFTLDANLEISHFFTAKLHLARAFNDLGERERAEELFLSILTTCQALESKIQCLEFLVEFHLEHLEFDTAFEYQLQLLKCSKQAQDEESECNSMLLSGRIFMAQGKFCEALECFYQSKAFAKTVLKRESYAQTANDLISECIEGKEKLEALQREDSRAQSELVGLELFTHLRKVAIKYSQLGLVHLEMKYRKRQFNLLLELDDELSVEEKHEFYLEYGECLEIARLFRDALIAYRNSLRLFDQLSSKIQEKLIVNKVILLCNIANSMDGMKEPFQTVKEIYYEALNCCSKSSNPELYFRIQRNLYELLWTAKEFKEARKIQEILRERFLIHEVEASEAELSEISSFSYFSNRKPSKKMKKLVGDFVMKSKKANALGLNLRRKKGRSSKVEKSHQRDSSLHTVRTSRAIVRKVAPNHREIEEDEMQDFLVEDDNRSECKKQKTLKLSEERDNGVDFGESEESSLIDLRKSNRDYNDFDSQETKEEGILIDLENNTEESYNFDSQASNQESYNFDSQANNQDYCFTHSPQEADSFAFHKPLVEKIPIIQTSVNPANSSILQSYKSKIKLYGHFPDLRILQRLGECENSGKIAFHGIFLQEKEMQPFFQFLNQECNTATKEIDLSLNAYTDCEMESILKDKFFPAVQNLSIAGNLLNSSSSFPLIKRVFCLDLLVSLDIGFMNCHSLESVVELLEKLPLLQNIGLKSCSLQFVEDENLDFFLRITSKYKNLSLDISYNSFSDNALKILLKSVTLKFESLKSLDLSGIHFPSLEMQNLLQDFYLCHSLERLALNACCLASLSPLEKFLQKSLSIKILELGYNERLCLNDFEAFVAFLHQNPGKLQVLALDEAIQNALTTSSSIRFIQA